MMAPLPSSPIVPGRTTVAVPPLHRTAALAPMRTATMTTAGLARNTADWSSASVAASDGATRPAARTYAIAPRIIALALVLMGPPQAPAAWTRRGGCKVRGQGSARLSACHGRDGAHTEPDALIAPMPDPLKNSRPAEPPPPTPPPPPV